MVKSTCNNTETSNVSFPKLMISKIGNVVLFHKPEKGVLVVAGNSPSTVGVYDGDWAMDNFNDYDGSITLKNEVT